MRAFALMLTCACALMGQATRTWVSGVGDDVNPCSRTAPCKTFAGAISKTAAGGEISVLDPGGFGAVTITKSITISAGAALGSIVASGAPAITINANPTDVVILRNLELQGAGTGTIGVRVVAAGTVIVENCTIQNFVGNGIEVNVGASSNLVVRDTVISGVVSGIRLNATAGTLNTSVTRTAIRQSLNGIWASVGNTSVTASSLTQMTGSGLLTDTTGKIFAGNNLISSNAVGLTAGNATSILVSNNDVVDNTVGFACTGTGVVKTAANNRKADNNGGASECTPSVAIPVL